jgi:hypothetical protein
MRRILLPVAMFAGPPLGRALKKGVKIVMGTDVGGFPWTELNQANEFEYYVQYGMTPMQRRSSPERHSPPSCSGSRIISGQWRPDCLRTSSPSVGIHSSTSRNSSASGSL